MAKALRDMATGLREIDAGNEGLCFLMDRIFADPLTECRRRHGKCDHSRCTKISAILSYVGRNFQHQERLMTGCGYPQARAHAREHQGLVAGLKAMQTARICADIDAPRVREFITRWGARHFHDGDRALGSWIARQGGISSRRP